MPTKRQCEYCGNGLPRGYPACPHCGRPGRYQNVDDAADPEEKAALETRYLAAVADCLARGAEKSLKGFEAEATKSKAVSSRPIGFLQPLAQSGKAVYSTYYKMMQAEIRLPDGEKWDSLRAVADEALFTGFKENIRFAALSVDGMGVSNYGDCTIIFRDEMIAHRASVFEENSTLFMDHQGILMSQANELPKGCRATWEERHKFCVAKLHRSIDAATQPNQYSALLLHQGAKTDNDDFVEVHIWGSMTRRTIERVTVPRPKNSAERIIIKAIKESFETVGATLEER
jgi:hypothetical protein